MPTVGKKQFPYTKAGEKNAKSYAKKTGKKMVVKKGFEGSRYDNDKGVREGSARDKARDTAEKARMTRKSR